MSNAPTEQIFRPGPPKPSAVVQPGMRALAPGEEGYTVPGGGAIAIAIEADDGVTNDLVRCVYQHREKLVKGFTAKFGVARLVYFEQFGEMGAAIRRRSSSSDGTALGRFGSSRKRTRTGLTSIHQSPFAEDTGCPPSRA